MGKRVSVYEMSLFDWCMIFLLCCVTACVHISTSLKKVCPLIQADELLPSIALK